MPIYALGKLELALYMPMARDIPVHSGRTLLKCIKNLSHFKH